MRLLVIGMVSLPVWYVFLVKQGYAPTIVTIGCVVALVMLVAILTIVRQRGNVRDPGK
jgi:hypothetical protein